MNCAGVLIRVAGDIDHVDGRVGEHRVEIGMHANRRAMRALSSAGSSGRTTRRR